MLNRSFREKLHIINVRAAAVLSSVLLSCSLLSGCSDGAAGVGTSDTGYIYYINNDETKTESYPYTCTAEDPEGKVEELLNMLSERSSNAQYKSPLSMGFKINSYELDKGVLTIDFDNDYKSLEFTTEVLVRAAIVKTICGSGAAESIIFTVNGEELIDHSGFPVGVMNAQTFISNDGNEINTYEEANIRLYFASVDGGNLVGVYRNQFYSTSMPLEKFVVDELIKGPSGVVEGLYPSVNPQTSVISVSTKDGVCYVNLSKEFLIPYGNVPTAISVYAIVDSLSDLQSIDKVQILVDGVVPETLESSYEINTDMVITTVEAQERAAASQEK